MANLVILIIGFLIDFNQFIDYFVYFGLSFSLVDFFERGYLYITDSKDHYPFFMIENSLFFFGC